MTKRLWLWKCLTWLTALLVAATAAVAAQPTGKQLTKLAEEGEGLFNQRCIACHTLGQGDRVTGPDLAGVTERRDHQWLIDFITNPEKMLASGDPLAKELQQKFPNLQMPAQKMEPGQMDALLTYLAHPEEVAHHPAEVATPKLTGDHARGEALFIGTTAFSGGGAPCLACHGIANAGLGRAAGASYGPDLSSTFADFGEEDLLDMLVELPFPSMEAIYATRPLNEQERADLSAFMGSVSGQVSPISGALTLHVVLATLVIFAIIGVLGWRRLQGVRRPLVEQVRKGKGELA
ncbi:MAG: c-type cytochrome [Desulfuromonadales bacterium]|nr:c-type cytochrome [Desulfuromonadales bacterium]